MTRSENHVDTMQGKPSLSMIGLLLVEMVIGYEWFISGLARWPADCLDLPRTEAMFQFAALVSKDGMSGIAPIIEFEIPTRSGGGSRINTLVGFTSTLGGRRADSRLPVLEI